MKRNDEEHRIQVSIVNVFRRTYAGRICAVPNGGFRGRIEAKRLKDEGVEAGHPDLIIYQPRHPVTGHKVYLVEVKTEDGPVSKLQEKFLVDLGVWDIPSVVVRSLEGAVIAFDTWGLLPKPPHERTDAERETGF